MSRRQTAAARALNSDEAMIPAVAADGRLYPIGKMDAHRTGVLHLAVSVFVFCGDRLLLQRRAADKYHCGGLWANTCCSHPAWGEAPSEGARRRLYEELGISVPLTQCRVIDYEAEVTNNLREHERVQVLRGEADARTLAIWPDPDEVSEVRWTALDSIRSEAASSPEAFAPWFLIYLARWDELGL